MKWIKKMIQKNSESIKKAEIQNHIDLNKPGNDCIKEAYNEYCDRRDDVEKFLKEHKVTVPIF